MKLRQLFFAAGLLALPLLCSAQGKMKDNGRGKVKMKGSPAWAAAHHYTNKKDVYFPDYYVFYDPEQGYYYWNNGKWTVTETVPEYMSNVDLNKARIEIIKEEIKADPQKEYIIYKKQYPAQKVEITVPVPQE